MYASGSGGCCRATGDNEGAIIKVVAAEFSGLLGNVAHVIIIWHDTQATGETVSTERLIGRTDCPPRVVVGVYPGVYPEGLADQFELFGNQPFWIDRY